MLKSEQAKISAASAAVASSPIAGQEGTTTTTDQPIGTNASSTNIAAIGLGNLITNAIANAAVVSNQLGVPVSNVLSSTVTGSYSSLSGSKTTFKPRNNGKKNNSKQHSKNSVESVPLNVNVDLAGSASTLHKIPTPELSQNPLQGLEQRKPADGRPVTPSPIATKTLQEKLLEKQRTFHTSETSSKTNPSQVRQHHTSQKSSQDCVEVIILD